MKNKNIIFISIGLFFIFLMFVPILFEMEDAKNTVSKYTHSKRQLDDYSNQKNKNNQAYIANLNNRANQLNPNNIRYYLSRMNNK